MKQNEIINHIMNKLIAIIIFFTLGSDFSKAQNYKSDTISFDDIHIIIKHKEKIIIKDFPYEEGLVKILKLKKGNMVLLKGTMVRLPFIDLSKSELKNEFKLTNEIRIIRGIKDSCHFREDDYFKYGLSIIYENVNEIDVSLFEDMFNNIVIEKI